jgi:hypothetical protein
LTKASSKNFRTTSSLILRNTSRSLLDDSNQMTI